MARPVVRIAVIGLGLLVAGSVLFLSAVPEAQESVAGDGALTPARGVITGLSLVASLPLDAPNADVWVHRGYAYVGTWSGSCPGTGVKVIDVRDPSAPRLATTLASYPNTSAEDVVVLSVDVPHFKGDLLAVGLQTCTEAGMRGLDLWDVTRPESPAHLAYFYTAPGGVHELNMVQREDGRVLALLAVPYAEINQQGGDVRIVDVTDPEHPRLAADWGIIRERGSPPDAGVGEMPVAYAHSVLPDPTGNTAYVSYWDAGVQILDIRDPERPRYVGNTSYPIEASAAEGNAHSVAVAPERSLLIQADEDFSNRSVALRMNVGDDAWSVEPVAATFAPALNASNAVEAVVVDVGRGCANDTYPADPRGAVALVARGECTFVEKAQRAEAAGATLVVVANNMEGKAFVMGGEGNVSIPAFMVSMADAARIRGAIPAGGTLVASPDAAVEHPWGFLRFYDISEPQRPRALSTFSTPHSRNEQASAEGRYSVHNPVWLPADEAVVASWFSDGVRVIDVHDASAPREVAAWTLPVAPPSNETEADEPKSGVWGVFVDGDMVYASDMDHGLYILRLDRR